ncbi:MAG: ABC transporter ATP-binding protein [Desulfurococcales archaeon]|nr:ABC transporter ATP-binding protein [Desulfurococcales archaeon]
MPLQVEGLRKRYRASIAVDGVTFTIEPGSIVGLLGPNGAGKTTTIKSIVGLVRPDSGSILVDGIDALRRGKEARRLVAYAPEVPDAPPWATPCELAEWALTLEGYSIAEARSGAKRLYEPLGVDEFCRYRKIGSLSKGQRKRILLALAFGLESKRYLLLDEPLTGLDPEWVSAVRKMIYDAGRSGRGVLVSSHLLREIEPVVDSIVIVRRGRTLFSGSLDELESRVSRGVLVVIRTPDPAGAARALEAAGYKGVEVLMNTVRLYVDSEDRVDSVLETVRSAGVQVRGFEVKSVSLEDVYSTIISGDKDWT